MLNGLGGVGVTVGVSDGSGLGVKVETAVVDGAAVAVGCASVKVGMVCICVVVGRVELERQPEIKTTARSNSSDDTIRLCLINANDTINRRFGPVRGLDSDERSWIALKPKVAYRNDGKQG
jgi:hypothetical protein